MLISSGETRQVCHKPKEALIAPLPPRETAYFDCEFYGVARGGGVRRFWRCAEKRWASRQALSRSLDRFPGLPIFPTGDYKHCLFGPMSTPHLLINLSLLIGGCPWVLWGIRPLLEDPPGIV